MDWSVPEKLKKGVSYARFQMIIYQIYRLVKVSKSIVSKSIVSKSIPEIPDPA
jgi:hypothetical protein